MPASTDVVTSNDPAAATHANLEAGISPETEAEIAFEVEAEITAEAEIELVTETEAEIVTETEAEIVTEGAIEPDAEEQSEGEGSDVATQPELMETGSLQRSIEALLFVASESLSIDRLVKLTHASHVEVAGTLAKIQADFAERGIVVREIAGGYRFASSPAAREVVEAYLLPPKTNLSPAAMETLAIVAYMQPVTKAEIEGVRGVNVESVVSTLLDRRFITEAGRRDTPGRPMTYKTTPDFLESFGLRSLGELPSVDLESQLPVALTLPLPETPPATAKTAPDEA
jgi:segregation and condensation protein B